MNRPNSASPFRAAALLLAVASCFIWFGARARAASSLEDVITPVSGSHVDFDDSGVVDYNDIKYLAERWLWSGTAGDNPADLSYDGNIDFEDFADFGLLWPRTRGSVAIFIDSSTYASLPGRIGRLRADIGKDLGVHVFLFQGNWTDIRQIKDIIRDKYDNDGLIGVLLIGDIPTAYFEYDNAGSTPTDWYFQDLSDEFVDTDNDGKFEREYYMRETDVTMRDIWSGRIKPPLTGAQGIAMLKDYLDSNHAYRAGGPIPYRRNMLYFGSIAINQNGMSEQDYFDLVDQIDDYTGLYDSDAQVDGIYDPDPAVQKAAYLAGLDDYYDFIFVNIHGTAISQWLAGSTTVLYSEIQSARPNALFTVLASCSNGDFTKSNYLAGWWLFGGNSLVVMANSVDSMLIGGTSIEFLEDYIPLRLGVPFGSMHENDLSFLVTHVFGDPTLTLRPKPTGPLPELAVEAESIDFGTVVRGSKPQIDIDFTNNGIATLTLTFKKGVFSINGEEGNLGYWDVFYYEHPYTHQTFRDFIVMPLDSETVPFTFYPRADGPVGTYSMTMLFQTNDPKKPYLKIYLTGVARVGDVEQ